MAQKRTLFKTSTILLEVFKQLKALQNKTLRSKFKTKKLIA